MRAGRAFTMHILSFLAIFFSIFFITAFAACQEEHGGEWLFRDRCQQCHPLPDPTMRKAEEWPPLVEKMSGFMHSIHKRELTDEEKQKVIDYLQAHAGGKK
jgi:hypothetical protein